MSIWVNEKGPLALINLFFQTLNSCDPLLIKLVFFLIYLFQFWFLFLLIGAYSFFYLFELALCPLINFFNN